MVKTKHRKSKPSSSKQSHNKKHGKQADISEFRAQLDALGLKIIQMTADGNCFFRALADQLEGDEDEHMKYRKMVVDFIRNNKETYEPFIEDQVPFDEYCQSMENDGTWAGHMELQAASLVTHSNICIHQKMSPRWYIQNFDNRDARMIHLSYHDEEHYNSVRVKDDTCSGAARPVTIKVLLQVEGNIDAAIEFLVAEQGLDDPFLENKIISLSAVESHGENQNNSSEKHMEAFDSKIRKEIQSCGTAGRNHVVNCSENAKKMIPSRNKACPCGSKKKYKSCCGSVAGRSSPRFANKQTVDSSKGRKDKKQGNKSGSTSNVNSRVFEGGPPDVGALCI
ncbi:OVARIAN TUMOR DOMAIN-containing deubiquitinating enzyme 7 isoform X2 [Daucus carota subsp. sativus]|uniref:OVARIAN TUMOR DOMAIN-containing deubiquitinating enzyme 7 isoform X2 n=1 Tax=Daucus carota subsp. sativus TaxID=79200 RepID=UPI003082DBF4